jgi:hypothetical protein
MLPSAGVSGDDEMAGQSVETARKSSKIRLPAAGLAEENSGK